MRRKWFVALLLSLVASGVHAWAGDVVARGGSLDALALVAERGTRAVAIKS